MYDNAIMENESGKVNIHQISYDLIGLKIRANVYTPAGYDSANIYPAFHPQYLSAETGKCYGLLRAFRYGFLHFLALDAKPISPFCGFYDKHTEAVARCPLSLGNGF